MRMALFKHPMAFLIALRITERFFPQNWISFYLLDSLTSLAMSFSLLVFYSKEVSSIPRKSNFMFSRFLNYNCHSSFARRVGWGSEIGSSKHL